MAAHQAQCLAPLGQTSTGSESLPSFTGTPDDIAKHMVIEVLVLNKKKNEKELATCLSLEMERRESEGIQT